MKYPGISEAYSSVKLFEMGAAMVQWYAYKLTLLGGKKILTCSICSFSWCKYSLHDHSQAMIQQPGGRSPEFFKLAGAPVYCSFSFPSSPWRRTWWGCYSVYENRSFTFNASFFPVAGTFSVLTLRASEVRVPEFLMSPSGGEWHGYLFSRRG